MPFLYMPEEIYNNSYGEFVSDEKGYQSFMGNRRRRVLLPLINPRSGEKILEIGCNHGKLMDLMSVTGAQVTGVDINKSVIEKLNRKDIEYMSITDLKFPENTFDKVCAFEVVEHIPEIKRAFVEMTKVLKKNGQIIISFPVEIIRGQSALKDALVVYKDIKMARKLHLHKLTPGKVKKLIFDLPLVVEQSSIKLIPFPSFVMILQKCS